MQANSELPAKPPSCLVSPTTVVCHDAGAANLIIAWLRSWSEMGLFDDHEFRLVFQGPAKNAWLLHPILLSNSDIYSDLDTALQGAQTVLTGTGWGSDLEYQARDLAVKMNINVIAVIDHWVNYKERFVRCNRVVLPNYIWVSDPYAAAHAREIFNPLPVIELENIYLQKMIEAIGPLTEENFNLLYVLEPIRNNWGKTESGELQALNFFAANIKFIIGDQPIRLILRPHPSDPPAKYDSWMHDFAHLAPQLDIHSNLIHSIESARWVVGAETFAMVISSQAGRATYSSLPPWAHRCRLPQKSIKHIRDLI